MSVRGKAHWEFQFRTFCDFGDPQRKTELARHFSAEAAQRAFKRYRRWYSREGDFVERHLYRCWQEDRYGNVVRDTGDIWTPAGV